MITIDATGEQLRADGTENVLAADESITRGYGDLVREAIDAQGDTFTAEDLRRHIAARYPDAAPHHPNVLPAIIGTLAYQEQIVCVGVTRTTRRSRHSSRNLVWRRAA